MNYSSKATNKSQKNWKAVLLLGCPIDPRNQKRINLLKQFFDLHVISWDRGNGVSYPNEKDGYTLHIIKIDAVNDPIMRLIPYFNFCNQAKKLLKEIAPILIDAQSLDMLRIAMSYKKGFHSDVHIIYEVADLHKLLVDKQKDPIRYLAQKYLRYQDIKLCKDIDLLIVTSEKYVDSYFSKFVDKNKIMIFPNVPDLSIFKGYKKREHKLPLTIGFIGGIRYKKQILNLLDAAKTCKMNVLLAGYESGDNEIETICKDMLNVEWYGEYNFDNEITTLYEKCDIIYSVYDADMANVRVALPNKLYEAVYCELPIIVAKNTYLAELVENWGVGVAVDCNSINDLVSILQAFQDNLSLFSMYEKNCRDHKDICNLEYYNEKLSNILLKTFRING